MKTSWSSADDSFYKLGILQCADGTPRLAPRVSVFMCDPYTVLG